MSHTPEEGEVHCKEFFPEDYDDEEEVSEFSEDLSKKTEKKPVAKEDGEDEEEEDEEEGDEDEGEEEEEEGDEEQDDPDLLASLGISPTEE